MIIQTTWYAVLESGGIFTQVKSAGYVAVLRIASNMEWILICAADMSGQDGKIKKETLHVLKLFPETYS